MDQLIAFHRILGSCVLGSPQKDYFFAVPWRGSFGHILTMQLEPPKFDKEKPATGMGDTDSNLGLCLQQGARGIVEIEVGETITRDTTKPDGLWPGDCYHGGLTVLSYSATRDNRGNSPYSQHIPFFTHLNNEHCDERLVLRCCLAMHDCLVPASALCMLRPPINTATMAPPCAQ